MMIRLVAIIFLHLFFFKYRFLFRKLHILSWFRKLWISVRFVSQSTVSPWYESARHKTRVKWWHVNNWGKAACRGWKRALENVRKVVRLSNHRLFPRKVDHPLRIFGFHCIFRLLWVCPREDWAGVTHIIPSMTFKLSQSMRVTKLFKNPK